MARTLDFWGDTERDGDGIDEVARLAFDRSWSGLDVDCVAYVLHSLNTQ